MFLISRKFLTKCRFNNFGQSILQCLEHDWSFINTVASKIKKDHLLKPWWKRSNGSIGKNTTLKHKVHCHWQSFFSSFCILELEVICAVSHKKIRKIISRKIFRIMKFCKLIKLLKNNVLRWMENQGHSRWKRPIYQQEAQSDCHNFRQWGAKKNDRTYNESFLQTIDYWKTHLDGD